MTTLQVITRTHDDDLQGGSWADLIVKLRGRRTPVERREFTTRSGLAGNSTRTFTVDIPELHDPNQIEFFEIRHVSQEDFGQTADNWNATIDIDLGEPPRLATSGFHRYDGSHRTVRFFPGFEFGFFHERLVGPPTTASWGLGRLDIFGLDKDSDVLQLWFDSGWHWANLGNGFSGTRFVTPLAATSWGDNRYDVFGLSNEGNVLQLWWDGRWHWSNLGNGFSDDRFIGSLSAASWGPNRIDVFGVGERGDVLQLWWDRGWHWANLGNEW